MSVTIYNKVIWQSIFPSNSFFFGDIKLHKYTKDADFESWNSRQKVKQNNPIGIAKLLGNRL